MLGGDRLYILFINLRWLYMLLSDKTIEYFIDAKVRKYDWSSHAYLCYDYFPLSTSCYNER